MLNKLIVLIFGLASVGIFMLIRNNETKPDFYPSPNGNTMIKEENDEDHLLRERWLENLHKSAPGVDWKTIEYNNQMKRHEGRAGLSKPRG